MPRKAAIFSADGSRLLATCKGQCLCRCVSTRRSLLRRHFCTFHLACTNIEVQAFGTN
jgi:hypothetical protein